MSGLPTIKLPCWLSGDNVQALKRVSERWWNTCADYIRLPLTTFDPLTCELAFVDLLAFQRGIDRTACETEYHYRLRVHHAMRNARAAGTPAGMNTIFRNLELPEAEYLERSPEYEWDMTKLTFPSRDYVSLRCEIDHALNTYWRTCRRFAVHQKTEAANTYAAGNIVTRRARHERSAEPAPIRAGQAHSELVAGNTLTHRSRVERAALPLPLNAGAAINLINYAMGNVFSARTRHVRIFAS